MTVAPIDLTQIVIAVSLAVLATVSTAISGWYAKHTNDKSKEDKFNAILGNAVGAIQQAVQDGMATHKLQVEIPHISAAMGAGIQYAIDQAPEILNKYSKEQLAQKLDARVGNLNIQTNIAQAASPGPTPQPLSPVPDPSKPTS